MIKIFLKANWSLHFIGYSRTYQRDLGNFSFFLHSDDMILIQNFSSYINYTSKNKERSEMELHVAHFFAYSISM